MYTDKFPILGNFIETKLTESCIESDTTLYVADTSNLPDVLTGKDYIPCVLRNAGMTREIVYVTAFDRSTNSLTVERGKEGTDPAAWDSGTYFYNTLTAASLQSMRVNSFTPLVDADAGRPAITRTATNTVTIPGDWTGKIDVGMAVRVISGDTVVEPTDAELGAIHVTSTAYDGAVTTLSFQNVSLPSVVSGLDLGISVAAAPMYHPDVIVADENTLTQEQNVIRISDAFQEAQAAQDAAIAAAQATADAALPKSGGTVNYLQLPVGGVGWNENSIVTEIVIHSDKADGSRGPLLSLHNNNSPDSPGEAVLITRLADGHFGPSLHARRDGGLFWNGQAVLTSAGGMVNGALSMENQVVSTLDGIACLATKRDGITGTELFMFPRESGIGYDGVIVLRGFKTDGSAFDLNLDPNAERVTCGGHPVLTLTASWRDGANWYRKYSDGWIEQGGVFTNGGAGTKTVTLNTNFLNATYTVITQALATGYGAYYSAITSRTTTHFTLSAGSNYEHGFCWHACGY